MQRTVLGLTIVAMGMAAYGQELLQQLTRSQGGRTRRVSSTDSDINGNGDSRTILPGQTLVLAELEGPGVITHFWNTTASLNPFSGRSRVLRMYWDGADRPSVEVPLGDFFGVGHGAKATFQSLPVSVSSCGRSRTCYWRMPFRKCAKITVANENGEFGPVPFYYYLDWEQVDHLPEDTLYFHARYRQQTPATTWQERLPPAADRVAPYRILLATTLKRHATPDKTETQIAGIVFRPEQPDGEISFEFDVEESGTFKVSAVFLKSIFGSLYQPYLDGKPLGPVLDLSGKGYDWMEYVFDVHQLDKGRHAFRLSGRGASEHRRTVGPRLYEVGISSLILLRLEDMEGYQ